MDGVIYIYMDRQVRVGNRLIHEKQQARLDHILLNKLNNLKYSNFSRYRSQQNTTPNRQLPTRRVKTMLNNEKVMEENKAMYSRIVSQKAALSNKAMQQERMKQVQMLRRIGKYPLHSRQQSYSLDERGSSRLSGENREGRAGQLSGWLEEEAGRAHRIVLWSRVVEVGKKWYTCRLVRFKTGYQMSLWGYPSAEGGFFLQLSESGGTQLLTHYDYQYGRLVEECIKSGPSYMCCAYQLPHHPQPVFLKFSKAGKEQIQTEKQQAP